MVALTNQWRLSAPERPSGFLLPKCFSMAVEESRITNKLPQSIGCKLRPPPSQCVAINLKTNGEKMTNTITLNPSEIISVQNNELKTTSLLVAETFKKRHRDIVRKIEALDIPNKFRERNFTPTDFIDKNGDSQKCIEMTKDGFVFLVMSFTGKLANQIKIAYIDAFNFMADKLYKQQPKLESPYIIDEELEHIKKGVGKMVHATGKHWQAVYRDLFDYVQAPSVREIKKERYALACEFLGIPTAFKKKALPKDDTPKLPELPKGHVNIAFNMEKNADYMVRVREGKASRKQLLYCLNPQDEKQDWWLEA